MLRGALRNLYGAGRQMAMIRSGSAVRTGGGAMAEREKALENKWFHEEEERKLRQLAAKKHEEEEKLSGVVDSEGHVSKEKFLHFREDMMKKIRELEDQLAHLKYGN